MVKASVSYLGDEEIGRLCELLRDFDVHTHNASGDNWRALGEHVRKFAAYCNAEGAKADERRTGK